MGYFFNSIREEFCTDFSIYERDDDDSFCPEETGKILQKIVVSAKSVQRHIIYQSHARSKTLRVTLYQSYLHVSGFMHISSQYIWPLSLLHY